MDALDEAAETAALFVNCRAVRLPTKCGFKKKRKKATAELQRVGAAAWAADFDWMMRK